MGENSKIEWTHHTFNPWIGCTKVHEGCRHCYAEADFDHRKHRAKWGPNGTRVITSDANWAKAKKWNAAAKESGTRARVFCASLADVFEDWSGPVVDSHGDELWMAPEEPGRFVPWRDPESLLPYERENLTNGAYRKATLNDVRNKLFKLIDETPWLDWLLLTKRPENIRRMWPARSTPAVAEVIIPIPYANGYHVSNYGFIYSEGGSDKCLRCGVEISGPASKKYCSPACRQACFKSGNTTAATARLKMLSPDTGEDGYQRVTLFIDGERHRELVHRIVLGSFVRDAVNGEQGCHADGNPRNNRLENLRWGTQSDNWSDSKQHGTHRRFSKLSAADVVAIRESSDSVASLAQRFSVSDTQIRNIINEKQWKNYAALQLPIRSNVFVGTSISDQESANKQIPELLKCRDLSPVLFLSVEPMLGAIDLRTALDGIDWVIVGGESGPGARPMHPEWVLSIRDQCFAAGVAFFFKQFGEWCPRDSYFELFDNVPMIRLTVEGTNGQTEQGTGDVWMQRVGKKIAGRLLHGREWSEFPKARGA